MTAQKSADKFLVNFKARIKSQSKTSILIFILHMISAPLLLIMGLIYAMKTEEAYNLYKDAVDCYSYLPDTSNLVVYTVIAVCATIIAGLCGIFIALGNFNYLYKKSNVDMVYALPMTDRQRFLSDYISGLTSYIAPFLVSGVFTVILSAILQSYMKSSFYYADDIADVNFITIALKLILFGIIIMILLYTLCVFAVQFSGTMLVAVANSIGLNALVPITILMAQQMFVNHLFGIKESTTLASLFCITSPAGALVFVVEHFTGEMKYFGVDIDSSMVAHWAVRWMLPTIAVSVVLFIGAYLIYRRRKAEDVSKPYVYRACYYILMTFATFIIMGIFELSSSITDFIFPMMIILAVFWLIVSLILNKGFRKIGMTAFEFVIISAAIFSLIYVNDKTEGFGIVYKMPELDDIKSVSIEYNGIFLDSKYYDVDSITLKEKENIETVYNAHKKTLEYYKEGVSINNPIRVRYYDMDITYKLDNGRTIKRVYSVDSFAVLELKNLDLSDEFIDKRLDNVYSEIVSEYQMGNLIKPFVNVARPYSVDSFTKNFTSMDNIRQLLDIVNSDLKNLTEEQYFTPTDKIICAIDISGVYQLSINKNYVNTLAWLEENGFDTSEYTMSDEVLDEILSESGIDYFNFEDGDGYQGWCNLVSLISSDFTDEQRSDLKNILENAQERFYSDKGNYFILSYNGWDMYITDEYYDEFKVYFDMCQNKIDMLD